MNLNKITPQTKSFIASYPTSPESRTQTKQKKENRAKMKKKKNYYDDDET